MTYIAHFDEENPDRIQTVQEHCIGVGDYTQYLCNCDELKTLLKISGYMHDVGKFSNDFQNYIKDAQKGIDVKSRKGKIDHSTVGAYIVKNIFKDKKYIPVTDLIANTIMFHHGLNDCIDVNGTDKYKNRISNKLCNFEEVQNNLPNDFIPNLDNQLEDAYQDFNIMYHKIDSLIKKSQISNKGESCILYKFYISMYHRLMLSMLIDADLEDTISFVENRPHDISNISDANNLLADTINLWDTLSKKLDDKAKSFKQDKNKLSNEDNQINKCRAEISQLCYEHHTSNDRLFRLTVPTGAGKTILSMDFAINYAKHHEKQRVIYVAPYISILEQNANVYKEIFGEDVVFEHHSNINLQDIQDDDFKLKYKKLSQRWNTPFIVTTAVQLLNSIFDGKKTSIRRFHALQNSVIIFDEVQSIPTKCISIFNLAINFLTEICNTCVVLCSATQPTFHDMHHCKLLPPVDIIQDTQKYFDVFKRSTVLDETLSVTNLDELIELIKNKSIERSNVLVVVNTISIAVDIYTNLKYFATENGIELYHLSTHMCAEHRSDTIVEMKYKLKNKTPLICISTQLIEAGVDISFSTTIRSNCGLDSIVQVAGRCNRSKEYPNGEVIIVSIEEEKNKISKLTAIQKGVIANTKIMNDYKNNPEPFNNDLFSDYAINRYFNQYYNEYTQKDFDFKCNINNIEYTLLDLLSLNNNGRTVYIKNNPIDSIPFMTQALSEAGKQFAVIDNNSKTIIVGYKKSEEEIIKLDSNISIDEKIKIIKSLQRYTISLNDTAFKSLEKDGKIYFLSDLTDVAILHQDYYKYTNKDDTTNDCNIGLDILGNQSYLFC